MCGCPFPPHNCFISHRKIQGGLLSSVRTVSLGGLLCNPGGHSPNGTTSQCWDRISDWIEGAEQKQRALEGIRPDLKATAKKVSSCHWAHLLPLKTWCWVCPAIGTADPWHEQLFFSLLLPQNQRSSLENEGAHFKPQLAQV